MKITSLHTQYPRLIIATLLAVIVAMGASGQSLEGNTTYTDTNGKTLKLNDFRSKKGILLFFYCNSCPYSEYYSGRIQEIKKLYPQMETLLVNASPEKYDPKESASEMKKVASNLGMRYFKDNNQELMKQLQASKCPEAFLLAPSNGKWNVVYHGAIDDNPQSEGNVKKTYLKNAVDSFIGGGSTQNDFVRPIGCSIKRG